MAASGGGTVGLDRVADIVIPANDNPYGSVAFARSLYRVQEPLGRSSCANITVRRRYVRGLLLLQQCGWGRALPALTKHCTKAVWVGEGPALTKQCTDAVWVGEGPALNSVASHVVNCANLRPTLV